METEKLKDSQAPVSEGDLLKGSEASVLCGEVIETLEMHTCCEPVRIVRSGYPAIEGNTILEKRQFVLKHLDHLRKRLMLEPRGGAAMYGVIPVSPDLPHADMAVLFMHNEGYSTMCGHAIISLGRYALDYNIVSSISPETKVNIQCPCGLISVFVEYSNGKSGRVRFLSVPCFVYAQDLSIELKGYGRINYDIAFGGTFYAFATAEQFGLDLKSSPAQSLRSAAFCLTEAVRESVVIEHPESPDLAFLYGTILIDSNDQEMSESSTSICIFADAQVDRSPCGSGTSARVALQYFKYNLKIGHPRKFFGPSGGYFTAQAVREETSSDGTKRVVVEVSGQGYYCGTSRFTHEPDDPHLNGFLLK